MGRFIHDMSTILRPTGGSSKFVMYYELLDTFGKPGCPVCTNLERGSLKALNDMLYSWTCSWAAPASSAPMDSA